MAKVIKIILTLLLVSFAIPSCCQDHNDSVFDVLNTCAQNGNVRKGLTFLSVNKNSLDSTSFQFYYALFNCAYYFEGNKINNDSCVSAIHSIVDKLTEIKDVVISNEKGYSTFYSIFCQYLEAIDNSEIINVYYKFKELWKTINPEITNNYINVLECTSLYMVRHQSTQLEARTLISEIILLMDNGYKFSYGYNTYLFLEGNCNQNLGEDEEALKNYNESYSYYPENRKSEDQYTTLEKSRFDLSKKLLKIDIARHTGSELLNIYKAKGNTKGFIDVSIGLAQIEILQYNCAEAIKLYVQALEKMINSSEYSDNAKSTYINELNMAYNTCDVPLLKRRFGLNRKNDTDDMIRSLFNESIQTEAEAKNIEKKLEFEKEHVGNNLYNYLCDVIMLAQYYMLNLQIKEAFNLVNTAIRTCSESHLMESAYAPLFDVKGDIYSTFLEDLEQGKFYHKKAVMLYSESNQFGLGYLRALCNISQDSRFLGDYIDAKIYIDKAFEKISSRPDLTNNKGIYYKVLSECSNTYSILGQEVKALDFLNIIIADAVKNGLGDDVVKTYQISKVGTYLDFGEYKKAKLLLDSIGNKFIAEQGQWSISNTVNLLVNDSSCITSLDGMMFEKKESLSKLYSNVPSEYLESYWTLTAGQLNKTCSSTLAKYNTKEMRIKMFNCLQFTKSFLVLLSQQSKNSRLKVKVGIDSFKAISMQEPVKESLSKIRDYQTIKQQLDENSICIDFFILSNFENINEEQRSYAALITRKQDDSPILVKLCDCDTLDKISFDVSLMNAEDYSKEYYSTENHKIFDYLWKPIEKYIPKGSNIYISKAGLLNNLNIPAISDGANRLSDKYKIHNVISSSLINTSKYDFKTKSTTMVLYGGINFDMPVKNMSEMTSEYTNEDTVLYESTRNVIRGLLNRGSWLNLPGSLKEINDIKKEFSSKCVQIKKYTGRNATEESFKHLSTNSPNIIHISTHGFYYQPYIKDFNSSYRNLYFSGKELKGNRYNEIMDFNGLLMAGAANAWNRIKRGENIDDGILTGKEISELNLNNTLLVTLSACQTGLGEVSDTDGNLGLIRAFKMAGIKNVISTLWNVSDEATCEYMKCFYNHLFVDGNLHQAFNNSIKEFKVVYPDPYYWAAFTLEE